MAQAFHSPQTEPNLTRNAGHTHMIWIARPTQPAAAGSPRTLMPSAEEATIAELRDTVRALTEQLGKVIVGQEKVIEQLLIGLCSRGHCLLVGVPGLAKTLLVSSLARILDLS